VIPSFSIVVETENLETADQQRLLQALDQLAHQTVPPERAREVILIDSGDVGRPAMATIRARYPWIDVHVTAEAIDYYAAKNLGAGLTTGEVIVFFDCDVCYEAGWLEAMLQALDGDVRAEVVAGETSLAVSGAYTLAVLLSWAFPPWSQRTRPYATTGYAANNVAFRRQRLLATPIPLETGLRRGNCRLHARRLEHEGVRMLRVPRARAVHPTLPPREYYPRLWGAGFNEARIIGRERRERGGGPVTARLYALCQVSVRRCLRLAARSWTVCRRHPRWWLYLPLAWPLALSGLAVSLCGTLWAVVSPARGGKSA
jgi:glycosyltransferase involved in cell wall biosynthesis